MTNRERWVIYPLLFLAITLGLRDKIMVPQTTEFRSLRCHSLTIASDDGTTALQMGQTHDGSGLLLLHASATALSTADPTGPSGTSPTAGRRTVELGANDAGGYVKVFADPAHPALQLGHDQQLRYSGLTAADSQNQTVAVNGNPIHPWGMILPWNRLEAKAGANKRESVPVLDNEEPKKKK